MNSEPKQPLRPEANSFSWEELNRSQRDAFSKITQLLADATAKVDAVKQETSSRRVARPILDEDRCNRTVMLSGDRGMGKTSLLLTLQRALWEEGKNSKSNWEKSGESFSKIKNRIVWLETLDMETIPAPANLLVAILARIDRSVTQSKADSKSRTQNSANELDYVLRDLRGLMTNASLAWDGNIDARAPNLDPDSYASEVLRAEVARLSINSGLDQIMNNIALTASFQGVENPIFVLPVDDFDLNPLRCLELLRLLRMISVPRLFSIVLGDAGMAEKVLGLKLTGDLARISSSQNTGAVFEENIYKKTAPLANQALRKLIPPSQRILLAPMSVEEALSYRPSPHQPTIRDLLGNWKLQLELPCNSSDGAESIQLADNLENFLFPLPLKTAYATKDGNSLPLVYRAAKLFASSPRVVSDLWFRLNSPYTEKIGQHDETRVLLRELTTEFIDSDSEAVGPVFDIISRVIKHLATDGIFRTEGLGVREELTTAIYMNESWGAHLRKEFYIRDLVDHHICVEEERTVTDTQAWQTRNSKSFTTYNIPKVTEGILAALHDSMSLRQNTPILPPWLFGSAGDLNLAYVIWQMNGERVQVNWQGMIFRSFWEIDLLSYAWREALVGGKSATGKYGEYDQTLLTQFALHWMSLSFSLLLGENCWNPKEEIGLLVKQAERMIQCPQRFGAWRREHSLCHLAVLLSFESGLPIELTRPFWDSEQLNAFWQSKLMDIVRLRKQCVGIHESGFESEVKSFTDLQKLLLAPRQLFRDACNDDGSFIWNLLESKKNLELSFQYKILDGRLTAAHLEEEFLKSEASEYANSWLASQLRDSLMHPSNEAGRLSIDNR